MSTLLPVALMSVAAGGAVGAVCRFGATSIMTHYFGKTFPSGTLLVNVVGSFSMGVLATYFSSRLGRDHVFAHLVLTGFLGALTTFSSFSFETMGLLVSGRVALACIYLMASMVLCLLAVYTGITLVRHILAIG